MNEDNCIISNCPKALCFSKLDFMHEVFNADNFLQKHKTNVSLEKMRDDFGIYLKIFRSSMIELINKDYGDYVTLSSNLIGLDKTLSNLEIPIDNVKKEIRQIKQGLNDRTSQMLNNLHQYDDIRQRKRFLYKLIRYCLSVEKLASILHFYEISDTTLKLDIIERAATEFNHLKFHIHCCATNFSVQQTNEMIKLDKCLQFHLKTLLINFIIKKETTSLIQCLRIYTSIDKAINAEDAVRKKIVVPAVENIISEYKFQNDPLGLKGIYQKLENILDTIMKELLELTLCSDKVMVEGFNFLVNSYWSEVEQRIEDYLPIIFAPGNPKLFHKQFIESMNFLLTIEKKCTTESINQLRNHQQYERFLKKWNLSVYFQIRLQEISGTAEKILSVNISSISMQINKNLICSERFTLHPTSIIWDCLLMIWKNDIYLPQLLHRFWKLCLQLCSTYQKWCQYSLKQKWYDIKINDSNNDLTLESSQRIKFLVGLYTDIEKLSKKIYNFTKITNDRVCNLNLIVIDLLNDCIQDTIENFKECLPLVTEELINELLQYSVVHLKQINDIPRLFRRTNREVPKKPGAYVKKILDPLIIFYEDYKNIIPQSINQWLILALKKLTQQYTSYVVNVLTSVQKTEESLRRLKKIRDKSSGISTFENLGISDDEKIRLQLFIDVSSYIQMIKELHIEADVDDIKKLLEIIQIATKNKVDFN